MSIYIAMKHPACAGFAIDGHHSAVPAPAPCVGYTLMSNWVAPLHWVFGKFTDGRQATDGMGTMLWGHDWGPLKLHIVNAGPPTTAMLVIPLGACLKLQLPAATLQKPATGGAIHAGSQGPPAAAFTPGVIVCQSCWDIAGFGFVMPTGIHFCAPTGEFVPVNFGCWVAAFACGLADGLFALAGSVFGNSFGKAWAGSATTVVMALLGTTFRTKLISYFAMGAFAVMGVPMAIFAEILVGAGGETLMFGTLGACVAGLLMAPGLLLEYLGNQLVDEMTDPAAL